MAEIIIGDESAPEINQGDDGVQIVAEAPATEAPEEAQEETETEVEVDNKTDEDSKEETEGESEEKEDESKDEAHWKKFARQHESEKKKALAENEKLSKELEKTKTELKDTIRKYEINEVIAELGLNDKQVRFLTGETKTELLASGRELLEAFGSNSTEKPLFKQGVSKNDDIDKYNGKVTKETAWEDYQRRKKNS